MGKKFVESSRRRHFIRNHQELCDCARIYDNVRVVAIRRIEGDEANLFFDACHVVNIYPPLL